jgi:AcrR family transcriptional regulator
MSASELSTEPASELEPGSASELRSGPEAGSGAGPEAESPAGTAPGVRARVRAQLTRQIVDTARRHLVTEGAAGLSLRAVARELGMASSAVYRYVANRDELLTLLIVDAYDALGEAVERAEAKVPREDFEERYLAACQAARRWALKSPHEFALIYGSPVPGYAAPEITVGPASRVGRVLIGVLYDAVVSGGVDPESVDLPVAARRSLAPARTFLPHEIPDGLAFGGLTMWTHLVGTISFELFGHRNNVVADTPTLRAAFFTEEMTQLARRFGLVPEPLPPD